MPVSSIRTGADFVEVNIGGHVIRVAEADVKVGTKDKMASAMQALLQEALTERVKIRDLGGDDLDKTTDPAAELGERMFWEGAGGNKELLARSVIVESLVWDGEVYAMHLRRAE